MPDGKPANMQQQQHQHQQLQQQDNQDRPITFEKFMQLHPRNAEAMLCQLSEITGAGTLLVQLVTDWALIRGATRKVLMRKVLLLENTKTLHCINLT